MQNFQPIEYHLTRDFSRKMNATFEFIKQNWKSLGKASLMIAGPPVLIASLIMGSFFGDIFTLGTMESNPERSIELFSSPTFWLQFILAMILVLLSSVMSIATINNYILLYEELKTNDIPAALVWERVRKTIWTYLGTTIYFFFTFAIFCFVLMMIIIPFATGSPVVAVLGVWLFMFLLFYLIVSVSLTFFVRAYEGLGFFDALGRSFKLVRGKWWSTFGLIFILYFIMMIISYIPIFPLYIIMGVTAMHNISTDPTANPFESESLSTVTMALMAIYYMVQLLLSALPNIGIAFQYFNLVEMKEAKGLMSSIDSFGESTAPTPTDETY
ncbi:hypothetical protein WBG78_00695 [Chryseolinea sp. T2]|uniref:hypothetical protein n=1 Tax=Chryseolinea sp. T2 TaxID=3129255 RepID=UPI0030768AC5